MWADLVENDNDVKYKLRIWNGVAFLIYAAQVSVLAGLYAHDDCKWPFQVANSGCSVDVAYSVTFNLCTLVIVSLTTSAVAHLLLLVLGASHAAEACIRWAEHSVTMSLDILVGYALTGASELTELVLLAAIYAVLMWLGLEIERRFAASDFNEIVTFAWYGVALFTVAWVVIAARFGLTADHLHGHSMPWFVYYLVISVFFLHLSLGLALLLRGTTVLSSENLRKLLIILAVLSKSSVAWVNWGGAKGGIDSRS